MSAVIPSAGGGQNAEHSPTTNGRAEFRYRLHWHVLIVHFPISFFVASFGFMLAHLLTSDACFHVAAFATLGAGAVVMIPTIATGWTTWKDRYNGIKGRLFVIKIRISYVMLAVSILLVIYQSLVPMELQEIRVNVFHSLYFLGMIVLLLGAVAEGYYGGRLTHR